MSKLNGYFRTMLHAKQNNLPSFEYTNAAGESNTYVRTEQEVGTIGTTILYKKQGGLAAGGKKKKAVLTAGGKKKKASLTAGGKPGLAAKKKAGLTAGGKKKKVGLTAGSKKLTVYNRFVRKARNAGYTMKQCGEMWQKVKR